MKVAPVLAKCGVDDLVDRWLLGCPFDPDEDLYIYFH